MSRFSARVFLYVKIRLQYPALSLVHLASKGSMPNSARMAVLDIPSAWCSPNIPLAKSVWMDSACLIISWEIYPYQISAAYSSKGRTLAIQKVRAGRGAIPLSYLHMYSN